MDKEALIKNRFWIILGVAVALALVDWMLVIFVVPGKASQKKAEVEGKWNPVKTYDKFKHQSWVEAATNEADALDKESANVHKTLYDNQTKDALLMTWPKSMVEQFDFKAGKYAVEVVVKSKDTKTASLPPDDDTHYSGTLGETEENWFKVQGRDKKNVQFFRATDIRVSDEETKASLEFGQLAQFVGQKRPLVVTYVTGKFFSDELTPSEIQAYVKTYKEQLPDVLAEIGAVNVLGQPEVLLRYSGPSALAGGGFGEGRKGGFGAVGLGNKGFTRPPQGPGSVPRDPGESGSDEAEFANDAWVYKKDKLPPADNRFFSYVPSWNENISTKEISEEIWAAQENLWLTREIYRRIKAANDALAHFEYVSTNSEKWAKYRNFYWEIDLKPGGTGVLAKLKNMRPSKRQSIDNLHFLVRLKDKDSPPVLFPPKDKAFYGAALGFNETFTTEAPIEMPGTPLNGVFSVDQVLAAETAAVKRLDVLIIGAGVQGEMALSHRQAYLPLVSYNPKPAEKTETPDPKGAGGEGRDRSPSGLTLGGGPGKGQGPVSNISKHGLVLERYLEKTPQSRKVPVMLVVIVDPEQLALVEAALDGSALRFLTTQVLWARCQVTLGDSESSSPAPGSFGNVGPKNGDMDVPRGGQFRKGGFPPFGGPGRLGGGMPEAPAGGGAESQENLELTVYGVLTIYERPGRPDRTAPAAATETKQ